MRRKLASVINEKISPCNDQYNITELKKDMAYRLTNINLALGTSPQMSREIEENHNKEVKRFKEILEDLKEYEVRKTGRY
jgi:hypothetical protein